MYQSVMLLDDKDERTAQVPDLERAACYDVDMCILTLWGHCPSPVSNCLKHSVNMLRTEAIVFSPDANKRLDAKHNKRVD